VIVWIEAIAFDLAQGQSVHGLGSHSLGGMSPPAIKRPTFARNGENAALSGQAFGPKEMPASAQREPSFSRPRTRRLTQSKHQAS